MTTCSYDALIHYTQTNRHTHTDKRADTHRDTNRLQTIHHAITGFTTYT